MRLFLNSKKSYSFFTRMLLLCTVLLGVFSFGASIIIAYLSRQYEESRFLKNYELASITLAEAFSERFSHFNVLAGKIIQNGQCNPDLCALLEASSYDEVPGTLRNDCISLMQELCRDDRYLAGFYLYSPVNKQLYYYTNSRSYLSSSIYIPDIEPIAPFTGAVLDLSAMNQLLSACAGSESRSGQYYGIAATLFRKAENPLGFLIPQYSTQEFENILAGFDLDTDSVFVIQDRDGHTIFCSNPDFQQNPAKCYTNTITDEACHFDITYYVPKYWLPKSFITYLIVILAILVTVFSFGLYYLSYYLSQRNINHILEGMKQYSLNDLTCRIACPRERNEFTQIIEGFNSMCDVLQRNVERSYIYELQQRRSELYALQTSINPHFLYNTLEIIRGQILNGRAQDASHMTLLLSKIYRTQTTTGMFVTLADEMEFCENLMLLYQYRFQNFEYDFLIDDTAERYALPKNTLQPLIENYFVHGIIAERQDNLFSLAATSFDREGEKYILLSIANNGRPIDDERLAFLEEKLRGTVYTDKDTAGFALTNVYSRLRIVFRERCEMHISPGGEGMAFQIDLTFPAVSPGQLTEQFS